MSQAVLTDYFTVKKQSKNTIGIKTGYTPTSKELCNAVNRKRSKDSDEVSAVLENATSTYKRCCRRLDLTGRNCESVSKQNYEIKTSKPNLCAIGTTAQKSHRHVDSPKLDISPKMGKLLKLSETEAFFTQKKLESMPEMVSPIKNEDNVLKVESSSSSKKVSLNDFPEDKFTMIENVSDKLKSLKSSSLKKVKLTPEKLKEQLAKCGTLTNLKKMLAGINSEIHKISEPQKKIDLDMEDHVSVIKESTQTDKNIPAYQRYHALASPEAISLILPYKYHILEEVFRSTDQIVSMLHNRSEICTFSKLKAAVQEQTRKNFTLQHLARIRTVWPKAYFFIQDKNVSSFGIKKSSDYHLCVYANLHLDDATLSVNLHENNTLEDISPSFNIPMNATILRCRRSIFHNKLIYIVKKHHEIFLSKLNPPVSVKNKQIVRWHPKFPVDEVADIELSSLPEPPFVQKYNTAQDVLNNAKDQLNEKVKKALETVAKKSNKEVVNKEIKVDTVKSNNSSRALKGISSSLIERIRQKEAVKMEEMMVRSPDEDKNHTMLSRLPEFVRIIRNLFISERKAAIPLEFTITIIVSSYSAGIAAEEVEPHIRLIMEYLPHWLSIINIRNVTYIKIDRNMDINKLCDYLQQVIIKKR